MQWQKFLEAVNNKLRTGDVLGEIKRRKRSENEVMSCLLAEPEMRNLLLLWLDEQHNTRECKSAVMTKELKDLGNKEFQRKDYARSIRLYTRSAQYAQSESEDLSIAIANRSASLFYMQRYKDCLKDIELAVNIGYPTKLMYKLYLRAAQCHVKLKNKRLTEEALKRAEDIINECDDLTDGKKENIRKEIAFLKSNATNIQNNAAEDQNESKSCIRPEPAFGKNPDFLSASIALDCKYTQDKGRHVVANRDIQKGQVLFVEKPFAFVLLDQEKSSSLCRHCCHHYGDVPVPCSMCMDTLYCSMECWKDGWSSYHQWECTATEMGLGQQIGVAHLSLKVLLTCASTLDKDRFNEVQKLVTNIDQLPAEDLLVYGITAAMLMLYLHKYTSFLEHVDLKRCLVDKFLEADHIFACDVSTESGKQLFISSLLLRHTLQLVSNGHAITMLNVTAAEHDKCAIEHQDRVATAIYPSASMMNHSCDPSIINSFSEQYLIVKAIKDIPAGGEVFNCYGPHFRRMARDERQEALKNQYCFICKCEPCTSPELQYFLERFSALKCSECSGALYNVHSYSMHCLDCGATPIITSDAEVKEAQELFDSAQVCMELEKPGEALDKLKQCLSIRRNVLYKHHEDITVTLDFIGKVYAISGRWLDSISYLEHSIVGVEGRFGSDSIELANDLNKLTDICIQYLQEETNTKTKQYKNTLKKTRRFLDRAKQIMDLNYGPWNGGYREIDEKREQLSVILRNFNI